MRRILMMITGAVMSVTIFAQNGWSQETISPSREAKLKVAYLYNFSRYFEWPENAFASNQAPFVIGVMGDDPLGESLDKVAKRKQVKTRKIQIHRFSDWKDYQHCHILFLPASLESTLRSQIVQRTHDAPLLVVCDGGTSVAGTAVQFYLDVDGTIGFEINVDSVQRRNLQANAKLLKLARVVRDDSQQGEQR